MNSDHRSLGLRRMVLVATLLILTSPAFGACPADLGDVNADGAATVVDIQCSILVALSQLGGGGEAPGCVGAELSRADLDCSGSTDTSDIVLVIQVALEQPFSGQIDGDSDGCPDSCDECGDAVCQGSESCATCAADCGECEGCEPGTVEDELGGCAPCPAGTFSDGTGPCTACTLPKVALGEGNFTCSFCPCGTEPNVDGTACLGCPTGTESPFGVECTPCAFDSIAPGTSTCTCEECEPGSLPNDSGQTCSTCPLNNPDCLPPGFDCICGYAPDAFGECGKCAANSFSPDGFECLPCPEGTTSGTGDCQCAPCGPGEELDPSGPGCIKCSPGTFSAGDGECEPCPEGSTAGPGAESCTPCEPGTAPNPSGTKCN